MDLSVVLFLVLGFCSFSVVFDGWQIIPDPGHSIGPGEGVAAKTACDLSFVMTVNRTEEGTSYEAR